MSPTVDLKDAVVVITGASSGIGQAAAEAFASEGARLVLAARDLAALEAVADRCRTLGADAIAVEADVTDAEAVRALADRAVALGGRIDVWFSNVGVGAVGLFHETPMAAHEQVIRANLIGHMNDAHAVLPIFLRQGRGVFINMISLGGFAAAPWAAAYSASKFGLRGFSEALRGELSAYRDIHVCDVYPAFVDTPGLRHGANYTGGEISAPPPVLDPRRVARAVVRLARRPRPGVTIGAPAFGVQAAHALAPKTLAAGMNGFMRAYFRRARRVARTEGNLFGPPADPGGVEGGFKPVNVKAAVVGGAVAALIAGGLVLGFSRRTSAR
jgi:short-subunit dehydrogenase